MARKEGKACPDKLGKEDEEETRTNTSQSAAAAARISWFVILQIAANCLNFPAGGGGRETSLQTSKLC